MPSRTTRAVAQRVAARCRIVVDLGLLPVAALGLEEDHRVVAGDGLLDHPVARRRGWSRRRPSGPAVWAKYASGDSLWCSTAPMPPPNGMRTTTGSVSLPCDRACILASWRHDLVERGEDEAVELDLADRAVAAQRQADRGADDARTRRAGCRSTRSSPKSFCSPSVTRKTPPSLPTSSPMIEDLGVVLQRLAQAHVEGLGQRDLLASHVRSPRKGASKDAWYAANRALLLGDLRRAARRRRSRRCAVGSGSGRSRQPLPDVRGQRVGLASSSSKNVVVGVAVPGQVDLTRSIGSLSFHASSSLGQPVAGRVVGRGVGAHPVGERLDQRRAACPRGRGPAPPWSRRSSEHVVAVDPDAGEAEPGGALVERDPGLLLERLGDRPLVVLAEEDDGRVEDAGPDEGLVDVALAGGAVAEVGDDGVSLSASPEPTAPSRCTPIA